MADFLINVIVNPASAVTGARQTETALNRLDRTAERTKRTMSTLFTRALIVAGVAAGIRTLAGFEQAMSSVAAISGATEDQLRELTATARELGATTRFTATDAAEGLLFLSRAGFTAQEALESIPGTLLLAQSGALELGRAADIATNVLKGFRLETDQTARVVDVLALAANSSNTTVGQLGDAMSFVAPASASARVSLEQTAAAISALSNAGIQATRAGTGLRQILIKFAAPTNEAQDLLHQLGLTVSDLDVTARGLIPVLETLAQKNIGLAEAAQLVDVRQASALLVLLDSIPEIKNLSSAYDGAAGSAAEVARIMDDNLNGALLATKSAAEAVLLSLGEAFLSDALTTAFRGLAAGLRGLANNIEILVGLLAALAVKAIPATVAAMTRLGIATTAALGPIGLITVLIGTAIGALVAFQDQIVFTADGFVTLRTVAQASFEELTRIAAVALDFVREQFGQLTESLQNLFGPAIGTVVAALAEFLPTLDEVLAGTRQFVNHFIGFFVGISRVIALVVKKIAKGFSDLFENIFGTTIPGAIKSVIDFAANAVGFIRDQIGKALNLIGIGAAQVRAELENTDLELPDFTVPPAVVEFGAEVKNEFLKGFETDYVGAAEAILTEPFNRIVDRARELGQQAAAEAAAGAPTGLPDLSGGEIDVGVTAGADTQFESLLADLKLEGELLALNSRERERRIELLRIEDELGRELTPEQRAQAEAIIAENQALADQAAILEQIRGPMDDLIVQGEALNVLFREGKISIEEYNAALLELQRAALETDRSLKAGVDRALLGIQDRIGDTSQQIEDLLVGAFDHAADAIVDFARTGKLDFQSFVDSIIEDLIRLAAQRALLAAFGGGFGGAGTGLPGPGGGSGNFLSRLFGAQNGLDFRVGGSGGTDSQLVAFRATPGEDVSVRTPMQQRTEGRGDTFTVAPTFVLPSTYTPAQLRETRAQVAAATYQASQRAFRRNR